MFAREPKDVESLSSLQLRNNRGLEVSSSSASIMTTSVPKNR